VAIKREIRSRTVESEQEYQLPVRPPSELLVIDISDASFAIMLASLSLQGSKLGFGGSRRFRSHRGL
jgi:hypothetical protein